MHHHAAGKCMPQVLQGKQPSVKISTSAMSLTPSVPPITPLLVPNYMWEGSSGIAGYAQFWDKPDVTRACSVSNSAWSVCLDSVVRGALGPLKPVLGEDGRAQETLFPEEVQFLSQGMAAAGFQRR
jgi:hypothetical protein